MGGPLDDTRADGEPSSSSSSSLSGAEEARFPEVQGVQRRLWAGTRAAVAPRLREASENAAGDLVAWTRQGGGPRALVVASVGTAALVALTGLLAVVFFVAAVATNAIIVSVLVSLAAAGGFLAVLLAFLAAIYVGALSVAVLVISATTVATVVAITIATGWVAFFWIVWFAVKKCLDQTTKRSTGLTNSVI